MKNVSALSNIHKKGNFGDYQDKSEKDLINIYEIKDLEIIQLVKYKKSSVSLSNINIDGISLSNESQQVNHNNDIRILWCGPNHWIVTSKKKDLLDTICATLTESDFAITDLSHSRAVIQIEGINSKEILKKGCPFNFNGLKKNQCANSLYNGIALTIDMIEENPDKIRLYSLRSFGESLYHSITDASLEYGFKAL